MPGCKITIVAYASFDEPEAKFVRPRVGLVDREIALLTVERLKTNANALFFVANLILEDWRTYWE